MKTGGRHERDYFDAAIEVAPPALQAIAAVAITFALTFVGHHFVPDWSVALTLVVGVITLLAASIWSWRARRLLLAYPRKDQRDARTGPLSANSRWWLASAIASTLLLVALSLFLFINGKMPILASLRRTTVQIQGHRLVCNRPNRFQIKEGRHFATQRAGQWAMSSL